MPNTVYDPMYEDERRAQYRAFLERQQIDSVAENDTLRLLVVYAELDRLGYTCSKRMRVIE
jgi:hypothetical protein